GCNAAQMDRLFRLSGLMREKWDRQQSGSTYGALTIAEAIRTCNTTYSAPTKHQQGTHRPPTEHIKNPPEQVRPPDFSDAGNAEAFTRKYRDTLLFFDALGWLVWNGQR